MVFIIVVITVAVSRTLLCTGVIYNNDVGMFFEEYTIITRAKTSMHLHIFSDRLTRRFPNLTIVFQTHAIQITLYLAFFVVFQSFRAFFHFSGKMKKKFHLLTVYVLKKYHLFSDLNALLWVLLIKLFYFTLVNAKKKIKLCRVHFLVFSSYWLWSTRVVCGLPNRPNTSNKNYHDLINWVLYLHFISMFNMIKSSTNMIL